MKALEDTEKDIEIHEQEGHRKLEAEIGVMSPQTKEVCSQQKLGETSKYSPVKSEIVWPC